MVDSVANVVSCQQRHNTLYKIYIANQDLSNEVWAEGSNRRSHKQSFQNSRKRHSANRSENALANRTPATTARAETERPGQHTLFPRHQKPMWRHVCRKYASALAYYTLHAPWQRSTVSSAWKHTSTESTCSTFVRRRTNFAARSWQILKMGARCGSERASSSTRTGSLGFHTLRNLAEFVPCVFLTLIGIHDCNMEVMDVALQENELRSES